MNKIGEYQLLNKIAEGGMAAVYLAKSSLSSNIDKFFAVKCLLPKYLNNQQFVELFINEARVQVNMNHGNVASIFDFGAKNGQFFIAMEHINGVNGRIFLKQDYCKLSESEIIYFIREAARGLDHAHNCQNLKTGEKLNIIHGDISPENIMVTTDGEVKVIDFGVAKEQNFDGGVKAGKKKYMSKAQDKGMALTARADIYSLGRTLLEYLRSHHKLSPHLTPDQHHQDYLQVKDFLDPEVKRIVCKALGYEGESYQTMKDFSKDLTKHLNITYPDFEKLDLGDKVIDFGGTHFMDIADSIAAFTGLNDGGDDEDKTMVTTSNLPTGVRTQVRQKRRRIRRRRIIKRKAS